MVYKIIKTESDYEMMLEEAYELMDAKENTPQGDRLELVSLLIEKYEQEHYAIAPPHPINAIKFRMEQAGLQQKDMVEYFGDKSKVSEVLNLKRPLSLKHIRRLNHDLHIPLESLIEEYSLEKLQA
jgi:HTH-type transcriptional regulator/antitoxin HigA